MNIKEYSEMFNKEYEIEDTVRIVNTRQAGLYVKHNVPLVDLFWKQVKKHMIYGANMN